MLLKRETIEQVHKVIDEVLLSETEKLLIYYAKEYQERPRSLIDSFLKFNSIRMASTLIIFWARKNGILEELKAQKDFSLWVEKQTLEDKWKPVLNNFLLILWGTNK